MATSEATRTPSVRDNGAKVETRARRLVTEAKAAFKTTEFWAMLGAYFISRGLAKSGTPDPYTDDDDRS